MIDTDTIVAMATPHGRGGVAIIRLSGPMIKNIITTWCQRELLPRQATKLFFHDKNGDIIDEGLAIYFPNPHSFTGEDVLELHAHGSPVVVDLLLQAMLHLGARLAKPGEFSERAFLNGKLDLLEAEAIADLISANSEQAARSAMRSLQGTFSKKINEAHDNIIKIRTYIEAAIDFSDQDIDFLQDETLILRLQALLQQLDEIQSKAKQGSLLREGIHVVIIGEPNVGKSSLLNILSEKEAAIVSNIPGTTRDVIREVILLDGLPLHIIDTAGLRESSDVIEQEGMKRAYHEIEKADLILHVVDAGEVRDVNFERGTFSANKIIVRNKIDLINEMPSVIYGPDKTIVSISIINNQGLNDLKNVIKKTVGFHAEEDGIFLARRRHIDALMQAKNHVNTCLMQLLEKQLPELAAEELRLSHMALASITGQFTSDDLLGHIFSSFCIGK